MGKNWGKKPEWLEDKYLYQNREDFKAYLDSLEVPTYEKDLAWCIYGEINNSPDNLKRMQMILLYKKYRDLKKRLIQIKNGRNN